MTMKDHRTPLQQWAGAGREFVALVVALTDRAPLLGALVLAVLAVVAVFDLAPAWVLVGALVVALVLAVLTLAAILVDLVSQIWRI